MKNPFRNRMNRGQFAIGLVLVAIFLYLEFALMWGAVLYPWVGYVFLTIIPFLVLYFLSLPIRRLHDIGASSLWLVPCIVPFTFLLLPLVIFLLIKKGNPAPNKHGNVPVGFSPKTILIG